MLLLALGIIVPCVQAQKINSCKAQFADGSVLDLSPLDRLNKTGATLPRFDKFATASIAGVTYTLSYNPCTGFTCSSDSLAAVCASDVLNLGLRFDIGSQTTSDIYLANGSAQIRYASVDKSQGRDFVAIVTLVCVNDPLAESSVTGAVFTSSNNQLTFRLNSPYSCLTRAAAEPTGWSIGDILLLIFGVLLVVYFIGMVLINIFVFKRSGPDVLPHREFWIYLGLLIKDGSVFVFTQVRAKLCRNSGYTEI